MSILRIISSSTNNKMILFVSSSRFTASAKYELYFESCFRISPTTTNTEVMVMVMKSMTMMLVMMVMKMTMQGEEERRGDEICNACVLLVKVSIIITIMNTTDQHHNTHKNLLTLLKHSQANLVRNLLKHSQPQRYRKLPAGSGRHWAHVVDAR